ncbi:coiled-coil domain-containing protein [Couchioplanes azureus]|uniref:hypothetical protein n=1 Tax=Couchioplanes caeruleus TaxID=56438 RepID=UPI001670E343|nr:hypothetical protein [Couchioplanes caeruleus]GGQ85934.1 hypothetical protein GCM10010166_65150 [Couchioplanes caeruleus subsp. azureus]
MSPLPRDSSSERTCERCGRALPTKPQGGRPYRFCPESPDEPGASCLELDKRERAALERAGLGELVTALRADRDALLAALQPTLGPLQTLTARLEAIEDAAIARAQQSDEARLRAEAAQRAAERAAREAEQRTTRAYELRDEALAERDHAVEDAQRYQRETDAALARATGAEHRRGQAEGAAAEQRRALDAEIERRTTAEAETDRLRAQLDAQQRELAQLRDALVDAERRVGEAGTRSLAAEAAIRAHETEKAVLQAQAARDAAALTELRRDAAQARTALAEAQEQVAAAEQRATAARQDAEALRGELDVARREAEELTRQTAAADARAQDAERRYDGLVAALAGGGFTAGVGRGPGGR